VFIGAASIAFATWTVSASTLLDDGHIIDFKDGRTRTFKNFREYALWDVNEVVVLKGKETAKDITDDYDVPLARLLKGDLGVTADFAVIAVTADRPRPEIVVLHVNAKWPPTHVDTKDMRQSRIPQAVYVLQGYLDAMLGAEKEGCVLAEVIYGDGRVERFGYFTHDRKLRVAVRDSENHSGDGWRLLPDVEVPRVFVGRREDGAWDLYWEDDGQTIRMH
jgi:hypothetical protein